MDLSFSSEHEEFRTEVCEFLENDTPQNLREKARRFGHFAMPEVMEWHKVLAAKGWVAPHWPKEHGGPGWDAARRFIFDDEVTKAGFPALSPFGLVMVGPLIIRFGTDEQKAKYLPRIISGEDVWCQGYSEPGAGSDLASLRLSADDQGDHYLLNGQKTWTTYAQYANHIFCLVRTSTEGKKQAGISFMVMPIDLEGIEVKPMMTLGHTPAFCDTFFENVKVPKENLLGPLDGGWGLAKALLGHERTMVAAVSQTARILAQAKFIAETTLGSDGKPLLEDDYFRLRLARLEIRLRAHRMVNYRALAEQQKGHHPGPESSILKLVGSHLMQAADELNMELMGRASLSWFNGETAVPAEQEWVASLYCYDRASTIYAGSSEVQKNVISKLILGLPKK